MHDYIHPNQPEDEVQTAEGEYLMYRSSSDFTAMRLNVAKSAPKSLTESWTDSHRHTPYANDPLTNWRYILNQKPDKGPYETVMFWFLVSDSEQHEPLSDTIERRVLTWLAVFNLRAESTFSPSRLMTFIREGGPYPCKLDRPPPRVQHLTSTAWDSRRRAQHRL